MCSHAIVIHENIASYIKATFRPALVTFVNKKTILNDFVTIYFSYIVIERLATRPPHPPPEPDHSLIVIDSKSQRHELIFHM